MKSKIDILKMADLLTPKERAKMMVLSFDEEYKAGKSNLSKEERDKLRTFNDSNKRELYRFYFDLRFDFSPIIYSGVESLTLRIMIGYLLAQLEISKKSPDLEMIDGLAQSMRDNYNQAYTYQEIANHLIKKYEFPVVGESQMDEIASNLELAEMEVNIVANSIFILKPSKKRNKIPDKPEIVSDMMESFIKTLDKYAKECGFGIM